MNPIYVAELFPILDSKLEGLLRSLSAEQWELRATPNWTVHQVACHLLDGNLRRLSLARDHYIGEAFSGSSYQDLVGFLNGLNSDWVKAFQRISPRVLIGLLEIGNREVAEYFQLLEPRGTASFAVAWAGESKSENWFDIAREYTEKWHHQKQIREAVGKDGEIESRELYYPVLDTFMRVLPHHYRNVSAATGTTIAVRVTGEAGGNWFLQSQGERWSLTQGQSSELRAEVVIPQSVAWKLFTKGLPREAAQQQLRFFGDKTLTDPMFDAIAIMG